MNQETSFQSSEESLLCANGCGFFGSAANNNLCSKCFRYLKMKEDNKLAIHKKFFDTKTISVVSGATSAPEPTVDGGEVAEEKVPVVRNRCGCCNKKVGFTRFTCRCGATFCGTHRYPEEHNCSFDFKGQGKAAIAKANPIVKADKIQRF